MTADRDGRGALLRELASYRWPREPLTGVRMGNGS